MIGFASRYLAAAAAILGVQRRICISTKYNAASSDVEGNPFLDTGPESRNASIGRTWQWPVSGNAKQIRDTRIDSNAHESRLGMLDRNILPCHKNVLSISREPRNLRIDRNGASASTCDIGRTPAYDKAVGTRDTGMKGLVSCMPA